MSVVVVVVVVLLLLLLLLLILAAAAAAAAAVDGTELQPRTLRIDQCLLEKYNYFQEKFRSNNFVLGQVNKMEHGRILSHSSACSNNAFKSTVHACYTYRNYSLEGWITNTTGQFKKRVTASHFHDM
jgi:hypothetical protein